MRPNAPWFWTEKNGWYVNLAGKRHLLAKGKENKKSAMDGFYRLMVDQKAVIPSAGRFRVKELCDLFLDHTKRNNSEATFTLYHYYLQSFCDTFGHLLAVEVKPFHVTKWLDSHPKWQGSRRHGIVSLKRCYSWACNEGLIAASPIEKIVKPPSGRRERVLSPQEKQLVLSSVTCKHFFNFLTALLETGCRPSEVAKVTAGDVNLIQGVWVLKKHKTIKKTGRPRIIYLSPTMLELTKQQVAARPEGPLFVGKRGQAYTKNAIRCHFRRIRAKHPELHGVVAYTCRHTYATNALVNGVGVAQVAELLGHTSTEMVSKHYGHLAQHVAHMRNAAAQAVQVQ